MAEEKNRSYHRKSDPGLRIQRLLVRSDSPEEILFKINELLFEPGDTRPRKNVRAPVSVPVTCRVGDKEIGGLSYTLSQGGVFIKSPEPLPEATVVEMTLALPGEEKAIQIQGEVVHRISPDEARGKKRDFRDDRRIPQDPSRGPAPD